MDEEDEADGEFGSKKKKKIKKKDDKAKVKSSHLSGTTSSRAGSSKRECTEGRQVHLSTANEMIRPIQQPNNQPPSKFERHAQTLPTPTTLVKRIVRRTLQSLESSGNPAVAPKPSILIRASVSVEMDDHLRIIMRKRRTTGWSRTR